MKQLFLCGYFRVPSKLKNALLLTGSIFVFFLVFMPVKGFSGSSGKVGGISFMHIFSII